MRHPRRGQGHDVRFPAVAGPPHGHPAGHGVPRPPGPCHRGLRLRRRRAETAAGRRDLDHPAAQQRRRLRPAAGTHREERKAPREGRPAAVPGQRRPFAISASTAASITPSPRWRSSSPRRTRSGSHASASTVPSRRTTAGAVTTGRQNTAISPAAGAASPPAVAVPPRTRRPDARSTTVPAGVPSSAGLVDPILALHELIALIFTGSSCFTPVWQGGDHTGPRPTPAEVGCYGGVARKA